ncbi:MAG TPA: hypothetical protein VFA27_04115 [Vicinamibacterales bacterium]|nr:hypothetical protein [Vicinamibacterales bacterium]
MHRLLICGALVMMTSACSNVWPYTDIVSITTEDVGDYNVALSASGDTVTATVCVVYPSHADEIKSRIVRQLYTKGYRTVHVNVIPLTAAPPPASPRCDVRAPEPLMPAAVRSPAH